MTCSPSPPLASFGFLELFDAQDQFVENEVAVRGAQNSAGVRHGHDCVSDLEAADLRPEERGPSCAADCAVSDARHVRGMTKGLVAELVGGRMLVATEQRVQQVWTAIRA